MRGEPDGGGRDTQWTAEGHTKLWLATYAPALLDLFQRRFYGGLH